MAGMETYVAGAPVSLVVPRYEDAQQRPVDPTNLRFVAWQDVPDEEPVRYVYGPDEEFEKRATGEYVIHFTPPLDGVWRVAVLADDAAPWSSYFYAKPVPLPAVS